MQELILGKKQYWQIIGFDDEQESVYASFTEAKEGVEYGSEIPEDSTVLRFTDVDHLSEFIDTLTEYRDHMLLMAQYKRDLAQYEIDKSKWDAEHLEETNDEE
jgi:hypothetical protein